MRALAPLLAVAVLALAPAARAADPCVAAPTVTPLTDLRFGRLVVNDRGGSVQLPAPDCAVSSSDGIVRLVSLEAGCAQVRVEGGTANANRLVQVRIQAPSSFSFASGGGLAQIFQLSLSGTGVQGADRLYLARLDAAGRSDLKLGARLRIVNFAPGEIIAPISLSVNYVGCPL